MPTELRIPAEVDIAEFISKEAHDLKSPFNRILGFIKLVLRGMDGSIPDQARDDLSTAHQNSLYAIALMGGLVEMSRISRGEKDVTPVGCQVDDLLRQVASDWKRQYSKSFPAEVILSVPACRIPADEIVFRQCLSNWISYVVEFVQETALVNIQVEEQPSTYLFTIRSSGKRVANPPACDLTIYGYIAQKTLELHRGVLLRLEAEAQGALVQFSWPKENL